MKIVIESGSIRGVTAPGERSFWLEASDRQGATIVAIADTFANALQAARPWVAAGWPLVIARAPK